MCGVDAKLKTRKRGLHQVKKFDSVKQIEQRYPHQAQRAKRYQYLDEGSEFFEALYEYFKYDMPHSVRKYQGTTPTEWLVDELIRRGFFNYV